MSILPIIYVVSQFLFPAIFIVHNTDGTTTRPDHAARIGTGRGHDLGQGHLIIQSVDLAHLGPGDIKQSAHTIALYTRW